MLHAMGSGTRCSPRSQISSCCPSTRSASYTARTVAEKTILPLWGYCSTPSRHPTDDLADVLG
jgi:hypothetical protein